jgi:SapB morphogen precursor RamS
MGFVLNLQKMVAFNDSTDAWSTASNHCSSASTGCGGGASNVSVTLCQ